LPEGLPDPPPIKVMSEPRFFITLGASGPRPKEGLTF
jgi:hypothetical protein